MFLRDDGAFKKYIFFEFVVYVVVYGECDHTDTDDGLNVFLKLYLFKKGDAAYSTRVLQLVHTT